MARFDVYGGPGARFLLDVQTDLLTGFNTRLVVPLMPVTSVPAPTRRLHPIFEIQGGRHLMATHLMASFPSRELGPVVDNLRRHYDEVVAAVDMIFLGF
jgi:toxin CcdB